MLGLSIQGQFLTLAPDSQVQLTRNSPFLTKDTIPGEYSLELSIVYTEQNNQLLNFAFNYYSHRQKWSIDAVLHDGTAIAYHGSLVLDTLQGNINHPQAAVLTGHFFCGATPFMAQVKDVLLKDIPLGGRQFAWTTGNPYDGSNGFWQHVHRTWRDSSYGFVFYPVRNEGWAGEDGDVDYQNKMERNPGGFRLSMADNYTSLCPHLYLHVVLTKLFEHYGYTLSGPVLQDPDFLKLTIVSFRACKWKNPYSDNPYPNIGINLADHVPPTKKATDLLLELQQYFAITFIIDPATRTVELTALKDLRTSATRKDWTQYAEPAFKSDFSEDKKVYALKTEIEGDDSLAGSAIDLSDKVVLPSVENHEQLMYLQSNTNVDKYCYCYRDNAWYQLVADQITFGLGWLPANMRMNWVPTNYNIHSYEPAGATDSFDSKISTLPMLWTADYATAAGQNSYFRLYPACTQEGNWAGKPGKETEWGFQLLFYRGMAAEMYLPFNTGLPYTPGAPYPFGTSTMNDIMHYSLPTGLWALPYVYTHPTNGYQTGVLQYWWRPWLDCLESSAELLPWKLWLPRHVLQQHQWTDVILIRNVPYLVQSFEETLPYPGYVTAELRRIG